MLICNTNQAKHDSNRLKKNWSILVIFQPWNVSQRKNPFFSLTARLGKISKIWKKTTQNRFILNILTKFQVSTLREWGCSCVTTTHIHTYIHTYGRRNYCARSDCDFLKKMHIHPFYFYTDRYSTSNTTKYVSYERWFIEDSHHS